MADLEDVTLDGRPLQSLRVADLKAALEERGLSKSGQKNTLIKRLKGVSSVTEKLAAAAPNYDQTGWRFPEGRQAEYRYCGAAYSCRGSSAVFN